VCGDGVLDVEEQCDDGNTVPGDGCNEFCQDEGIVGDVCAAAPATGCLTAAKASVAIVEKKPGKEKWKAKLKSLDGATAQSDFGDPVSGATRYDVCLYGDSGQLVSELSVDRAGQTCGTKPCWKAKGEGYAYKDKEMSADGVKTVKGASGPIGKGKLQVQAGNKAKKGQTALATGVAAALAGSTSARVQVLTSDAACLEAALPTVKKAEPDQFKAKAP
jgi:cysteine-rich repeat protein